MTEEVFIPAGKKLCECGCGTLIPTINKLRRPARFKHGHYPPKGKCNNPNVGERGDKAPCWKGGRTNHTQGYVYIYRPDHPRAKKIGHVFEHILVYEQYHKCCLLPWASVHHINHVRNDNRPENLLGVTRGQHTTIHNFVDMKGRTCAKCGTSKTIMRTDHKAYGPRPHWFKYNDGFLCSYCYYYYKRQGLRISSGVNRIVNNQETRRLVEHTRQLERKGDVVLYEPTATAEAESGEPTGAEQGET